jgi:hypothetical protein
MIKRVAMVVALVAMSGLLVFGGIHRTQSVLAGEGGRGSESVQVQDGTAVETGETRGQGSGSGQGQGKGLGKGGGSGLHGVGTGGQDVAPEGTATE